MEDATHEPIEDCRRRLVAFRCSLAVACLATGDWWGAWTVLTPVGQDDESEE
jgi:hypothetical protein